MKISLPVSLTNVINRKQDESKVNVQEKLNTNPQKESVLSFMAIPTSAYMSKLVLPRLPKGQTFDPKPVIQKQPTSKMTEDPVLEYKVFPQDPLITETDIYKQKGAVEIGPKNNRVNTTDASEPAKPDASGNYIKDVETREFDRVNSFLFADRTLKMYEDALGRDIKWAFPSEEINIHPRAGTMMNAYYSRREAAIKLFQFQNPQNRTETCYTSKMADVITHETGHAVLDGLKPSYIGWGGHGRAVHEGFGDSTAMLVTMLDEKMIDRVIKETGGDLRKENVIASLGEQFGKAVYGDKLYLRNAINNLKGSDFKNGKESTEEHNFGRLFGAFFYDVICDITAEKAKSMPLKEAMIKTRDDLTKLFARAMGDFTPPGVIYYDDVAKALLKADETDFGGKYKKILTNVLTKREVVSLRQLNDYEQEAIKPLPLLKLPPATLDSNENITDFINKNKEILNLPKENNYQLESAYTNKFGETFIQMKSPKTIQMPDDMYDPWGMGGYAIEVYEGLTLGFDKTGKLFHKAETKLDEEKNSDAIKDVLNTIKKMENLNAAGDTKTPPMIYVKQGANGSNILVRYPRLDDPIIPTK